MAEAMPQPRERNRASDCGPLLSNPAVYAPVFEPGLLQVRRSIPAPHHLHIYATGFNVFYDFLI